eukprot:15363500-Ditylum_brightwellii.AAC.1
MKIRDLTENNTNIKQEVNKIKSSLDNTLGLFQNTNINVNQCKRCNHSQQIDVSPPGKITPVGATELLMVNITKVAPAQDTNQTTRKMQPSPTG